MPLSSNSPMKRVNKNKKEVRRTSSQEKQQLPYDKHAHWTHLALHHRDRISKKTAAELCEWNDVVSMMVIAFCVCGFLWCDTKEWAVCMAHIFMVPAMMEISLVTFLLPLKDCMLPKVLGIWFEEATLVIDEFGCQRMNRPNIIFGIMVIRFIMMCSLIIWRTLPIVTPEVYILELGCLVVQVCTIMRHWRRTRAQYLRKLQYVREEQLTKVRSVDRLTQDWALKILRMNERALIINSNLIPLEAQLWYTSMLRDGTPSCLDFLNEVLGNAMKGEPREMAKEYQESVPLYVQWQNLSTIQQAAEEVISLHSASDSIESKVHNHKPKLRLMSQRLQMLNDRVKNLRDTAVKDLGAADFARFTDTLHALVEVDRRQSRCSSNSHSEKSKRSAATQREEPASETRSALLIVDQMSEGASVEGHSIEADHQGREPSVQQPSLPVSSIPETTVPEAEEDAECICCFERTAVVVFTACGHLTYCKSCRKKAFKRHLGRDWADIRSYGSLLRKKLPCPLCRQESKTEEVSKFQGKVFS